MIEAIRNGMRGLDDLTNYVYAITNYGKRFNVSPMSRLRYLAFGQWIAHEAPSIPLTNGVNIVGLLSTPEYPDLMAHRPTTFYQWQYYSNHIVAYVRSLQRAGH